MILATHTTMLNWSKQIPINFCCNSLDLSWLDFGEIKVTRLIWSQKSTLMCKRKNIKNEKSSVLFRKGQIYVKMINLQFYSWKVQLNQIKKEQFWVDFCQKLKFWYYLATKVLYIPATTRESLLKVNFLFLNWLESSNKLGTFSSPFSFLLLLQYL